MRNSLLNCVAMMAVFGTSLRAQDAAADRPCRSYSRCFRGPTSACATLQPLRRTSAQAGYRSVAQSCRRMGRVLPAEASQRLGGMPRHGPVIRGGSRVVHCRTCTEVDASTPPGGPARRCPGGGFRIAAARASGVRADPPLAGFPSRPSKGSRTRKRRPGPSRRRGQSSTPLLGGSAESSSRPSGKGPVGLSAEARFWTSVKRKLPHPAKPASGRRAAAPIPVVQAWPAGRAGQ